MDNETEIKQVSLGVVLSTDWIKEKTTSEKLVEFFKAKLKRNQLMGWSLMRSTWYQHTLMENRLERARDSNSTEMMSVKFQRSFQDEPPTAGLDVQLSKHEIKEIVKKLFILINMPHITS